MNKNNEKIHAGGLLLVVLARKPSSPKYYKLKSNDKTVSACLATDFSSYNATRDDILFNRTNPTRIENEPYFDNVALLSNDTETQCPDKGGDSDTCDSGAGGHFETDEKVNFLSLTVLGLRILFLKSIVFNVLMTLRAWMS